MRSFVLFVRCWSLVHIFDWVDPLNEGFRPAVLLGCAVLAFCFPRVGSLLVLAAAHFALALPAPFQDWFVHRYLAASLHGAVLAAALAVLARRRTLASEADMMALLKWPARLIAAALIFPGLAKLNRDFLDPAISCGGVYYLWIREWPGLDLLLPPSQRMKEAAIGLALFSELAAPCLLWWRRTRPLGLVLIVLLALALSANTRSLYFEFIGLFATCSLFWLELSTLERVSETLAAPWAWLTRRLPPPRRAVAIALKVASGVGLGLSVTLGRAWYDRPLYRYGWLFLGLSTIVVVAGAVIVGARDRSAPEVTWPSASGSAGRLWLIALVTPCCLLLNEAGTYAGWSHRPALRMASNFVASTAGTNHLLLARLPRLAWHRERGLHIAEPYPALQRREYCPKNEPGLSKRATRKLMDKRLKRAAARLEAPR